MEFDSCDAQQAQIHASCSMLWDSTRVQSSMAACIAGNTGSMTSDFRMDGTCRTVLAHHAEVVIGRCCSLVCVFLFMSSSFVVRATIQTAANIEAPAAILESFRWSEICWPPRQCLKQFVLGLLPRFSALEWGASAFLRCRFSLSTPTSTTIEIF